mgnify:CR=1 FL=1
MKYFFILLMLFLFSGCELNSLFGPSKEEISLKNKELDTKLELQKNELNSKKELELAKIESELKKEQILVKKEEINSKNLEVNSQNEIIKLSIILSAILIIIISAALFIYFNNRRKDKLRAYEDNLDKYFRQKDRDAKLQIANKIIDTIAQGKLSKEQEIRLIGALSEEKIPQNISSELETLEKNDNEIIQLEFDENKSKKKKKKKKKL